GNQRGTMASALASAGYRTGGDVTKWLATMYPTQRHRICFCGRDVESLQSRRLAGRHGAPIARKTTSAREATGAREALGHAGRCALPRRVRVARIGAGVA